MGGHRHFAGDTYADSGFWSPSSSAANFCEEDYAVTKYVAEFINSLSNLTYIYLALRHPSSRPGHVDLMSASLVLVGVTSLVYHATLRQTAQLSDDLSMLLLAGALLRTLYCAGQPPGRVTLTTVTIYAVISAMSGFYVNNGNVLVHTAMFAGMLNLIWPRTLYLISRRERSAQEKAGYYQRFRKACAVLALAFAVWVIDLERCQELRNLRKALGLPWAWLFELHGWWHILTAIGAALYMELIRDISK